MAPEQKAIVWMLEIISLMIAVDYGSWDLVVRYGSLVGLPRPELVCEVVAVTEKGRNIRSHKLQVIARICRSRPRYLNIPPPTTPAVFGRATTTDPRRSISPQSRLPVGCAAKRRRILLWICERHSMF